MEAPVKRLHLPGEAQSLFKIVKNDIFSMEINTSIIYLLLLNIKWHSKKIMIIIFTLIVQYLN